MKIFVVIGIGPEWFSACAHMHVYLSYESFQLQEHLPTEFRRSCFFSFFCFFEDIITSSGEKEIIFMLTYCTSADLPICFYAPNKYIYFFQFHFTAWVCRSSVVIYVWRVSVHRAHRLMSACLPACRMLVRACECVCTRMCMYLYGFRSLSLRWVVWLYLLSCIFVFLFLLLCFHSFIWIFVYLFFYFTFSC